MDYNYKNKYKYDQEQLKKKDFKHKRSNSSLVYNSMPKSSMTPNSTLYSNKKNLNRSFAKDNYYNNNSKILNKKSNNNTINSQKNYNQEATAEDYQRITKKFYSIILSLQDELTKQTIKNYNLLEENLQLKEQFNEIQLKLNNNNNINNQE